MDRTTLLAILDNKVLHDLYRIQQESLISSNTTARNTIAIAIRATETAIKSLQL